MLVKRSFMIVLVGIIIISCNSNAPEDSPEEAKSFVAKIDSSMTLLQVAKANNIGEPYLRTKLDIPKYVGKNYTIAEMAQRFNFTIRDLKKIIEDRKNKQEASRKRRMKAKNKKN